MVKAVRRMYTTDSKESGSEYLGPGKMLVEDDVER
jgi:hypothetical protein